MKGWQQAEEGDQKLVQVEQFQLLRECTVTLIFQVYNLQPASLSGHKEWNRISVWSTFVLVCLCRLSSTVGTTFMNLIQFFMWIFLKLCSEKYSKIKLKEKCTKLTLKFNGFVSVLAFIYDIYQNMKSKI